MKSTDVQKSTSPAIVGNNVLAAGFGEDDYVEGVFLIEAKSRETFFNRKRKL